MADDLDRAKDLEMHQRDVAIKKQLAGAVETEEPLIVDGVHCCVDCGGEIPPKRLEARPESVRCIDCKTYKEFQEKQYV